ncbi:ABC transporter permease [Lacisediminihabitans sp. G11-30]|uniref:ABC transporter permease n=2 Tax=Lacisediminihabitans changchengi TaxID=2787634 RepID=A0A934SNG8_9MICO|nr:ABC transporter permease [Lacisediminihabitans changchengi]
MRQRVRGTAWYIMLAVFFVLIFLVTGILTAVLQGTISDSDERAGASAFSTIIYFVLLLGTLVAPALSGNAINGDRDDGTLATLQVTLVSHWQIVVGKFLAAWVTALAFLVAALPFLVFTIVRGVAPLTILVSVLVLALELGVVAAIGVGLSGLIVRPLFSIVLTYLVVAVLSLGTLIAFGLGDLVNQSPTVTKVYSSTAVGDDGTALECAYTGEETGTAVRFDRVWGLLVANPYVLLADAVPADRSQAYPSDLFGIIKFGERSAQLPPKLTLTQNECTGDYGAPQVSYRKAIDSTVPGWLVGLIIQLALAGAALGGAGLRLRTPAGRLAKGSRIA